MKPAHPLSDTAIVRSNRPRTVWRGDTSAQAGQSGPVVRMGESLPSVSALAADSLQVVMPGRLPRLGATNFARIPMKFVARDKLSENAYVHEIIKCPRMRTIKCPPLLAWHCDRVLPCIHGQFAEAL